MGKRGVILFIVIGTILLVSVLGAVILTTISSQSRLTHHQVSRIQAHYAALAGVNYALDKLRTGGYTTSSCPETTPCTVNDTNFPTSINNQKVDIVIKPFDTLGCTNSPGNTACVSATASYTYTP